jgi:hypothetical protein
MLIIRKNEVNNLIATVSMNKTLPNPYYLFSFQHIASKERTSFYPQVITSNVRYDKFRFVESPTTNLSLVPPQVNFEYLGQYYYSIYENITSASTDPSLSYNKLESGRAWVIVGDDNTQECFFEPYISNDEDFSQVIYVSEEEEACQQPLTPSITPSNTPTPSITPSNTATPTLTPTNTATPTRTPTNTPTPSPTGGLPPGVLQFLVHRGGSRNSACNGNPNQFVYAQDLGNCGGCFGGGLTCWACLTTSQQVFSDVLLTTPVVDGYYMNDMDGAGFKASWHIIGGFPQSGGYMDCP